MFRIDDRVAGKWKLVRPLGRGAFGDRWVARHETIEGTSVLEALARDADEATCERFRSAARLAAKIARRTRHVLAVVDQGTYEGVEYVVHEHVDAPSLAEVLGRGEPLSLADAVEVVRQVGRALSAAHEASVRHGELDLGCVLFARDGDGLLLKVLGFRDVGSAADDVRALVRIARLVTPDGAPRKVWNVLERAELQAWSDPASLVVAFASTARPYVKRARERASMRVGVPVAKPSARWFLVAFPLLLLIAVFVTPRVSTPGLAAGTTLSKRRPPPKRPEHAAKVVFVEKPTLACPAAAPVAAGAAKPIAQRPRPMETPVKPVVDKSEVF